MRDDPDEMRDEYDLPLEGGIRGKYYDQYHNQSRATRGIPLPDHPFIASRSTATGSPVPVALSILLPPPIAPIQIGAGDRAVEVSPRR